MYIIVRKSDNVIIGTASAAVAADADSKTGYTFYEVDDSEFSSSMIGKTLESFEEDNDTI